MPCGGGATVVGDGDAANEGAGATAAARVEHPDAPSASVTAATRATYRACDDDASRCVTSVRITDSAPRSSRR